MSQRAVILVGVSATVAAVLLFVLVLVTGGRGPDIPDEPMPLSDPSAYETVEIPEFTLVDQDGKTVTKDYLRSGEAYTVMDFMFSNCQLACPIMSGNMLVLSQALEPFPVRFLSVSVDPVNDTPERLRQYAADLGADTGRWTFATGKAGEAARLVSAMQFAPLQVDESEEHLIQLPDGSVMNNIVHPSRFIVVDPEGRVVGMYRGMNTDEVGQLELDLKRIIRERGM